MSTIVFTFIIIQIMTDFMFLRISSVLNGPNPFFTNSEYSFTHKTLVVTRALKGPIMGNILQ